MLSPEWHMITGEYPPQAGGVSDYSRLLARELAKAGDSVHVWAPACTGLGPVPSDPGVHMHGLPGRFGPRALAVLTHRLNQYPAPRHLVVQYVPHAFGWKAMNILFCLWLRSQRHDRVWVIFHEVAFPINWRQSLVHNFMGIIQRLMAMLVARSAKRTFVSTQAWERLLRPVIRGHIPITWLPVPSNVPVVEDPGGSATIRTRYGLSGGLLIGHFGTFGCGVAYLLNLLLPLLLTGHSQDSILLLGRGSEHFRARFLERHSRLTSQVHASGDLIASDLSLHFSACDAMIQPYPDGVSSRRTSIMAGLSHGRPVVTTMGPLTETIWASSGAVEFAPVDDMRAFVNSTRQVLADEKKKRWLSAAARSLYEERFDIRHTIAALRS